MLDEVIVRSKGRRLVLALLALAACGRTGLGPFGDEPVAGGEQDGGEPDDAVGFDDGLPPDEPPDDRPDAPPPDASCGNGIIDPGELCFLPEITYWSRIDPCAIDVGDIDGDGNLDVITPNSDFEHVESSQNFTSVLYGDGHGHLSEPVPYDSIDDIPVGVRLGDLDGDGQLDAVVVNSDAGSLTTLLNIGDRNLVFAGRVQVGESPMIADLGDLDHDGVLDVAVTVSDGVAVARGRGDGTFDPPALWEQPGQVWAPRLFDVDLDGNLDLLASVSTEARVRMWYGDGTGSFISGHGLPTFVVPLGLLQADVDADGKLDLLVAHGYGMSSARFDLATSEWTSSEVEAGIDPRAIAAADFDADGRLDAAVVNSGSEDVTLTIGDGEGGFVHGATYRVGTLPSGISAGDFNGDGVPDMAVSNQLSNSIGLILSNP